MQLSERAERMSNRESHCYNLPHFRRVSVPRDYAQSRSDEEGSSAALSAARARRIVHRGFVVGDGIGRVVEVGGRLPCRFLVRVADPFDEVTYASVA